MSSIKQHCFLVRDFFVRQGKVLEVVAGGYVESALTQHDGKTNRKPRLAIGGAVGAKGDEKGALRLLCCDNNNLVVSFRLYFISCE